MTQRDSIWHSYRFCLNRGCGGPRTNINKIERDYFEENHQMGRIQISNIHDSSNLLALCSICHFAFDAKQWTFLPDDLRKWVDMLKSDPESDHIRNWNSNRDVTFRRWRLVGAADWESSKDDAYVSYFHKGAVEGLARRGWN